MKTCFVFCHGFGFDASFWDLLCSYFAKTQCAYMDLGYFGDEKRQVPHEQGTHIIGIGHSLGFMKLIESKVKFKSLIGLHGFANFLGDDPTLRKKRKAELETLKQHFNVSPTHTLQSFYKRCGVPIPHQKLERLNRDRLANDLDSLSLVMSIPSDIPILLIGAKNDPVVPAELIFDNFEAHSNVTIDMMENGRHCLGYSEPKIVTQKIMSFIKWK